MDGFDGSIRLADGRFSPESLLFDVAADGTWRNMSIGESRAALQLKDGIFEASASFRGGARSEPTVVDIDKFSVGLGARSSQGTLGPVNLVDFGGALLLRDVHLAVNDASFVAESGALTASSASLTLDGRGNQTVECGVATVAFAADVHKLRGTHNIHVHVCDVSSQ
jgi:hypothetical protein